MGACRQSKGHSPSTVLCDTQTNPAINQSCMHLTGVSCCSMMHGENWKQSKSTSKAHVKVLQNVILQCYMKPTAPASRLAVASARNFHLVHATVTGYPAVQQSQELCCQQH